jgi:hypothetical protein
MKPSGKNVRRIETHQMKEVKRAMLSKIAGQLNHLEKLISVLL